MTEDSKNLEKLKLITSYFQHEGSLYWSRSNSFLVANSIMLALVARIFFELEAGFSSLNIIAFLITILGLSLTRIWYQALCSGEFWIYHWHQHLKKLEANVFGSLSLFEFEKKDGYPKYLGAKKTAHLMLYVFIIAWGFLCLFVLFKTLIV